MEGVAPAQEGQQSKEGITEGDQRCPHPSTCAKDTAGGDNFQISTAFSAASQRKWDKHYQHPTPAVSPVCYSAKKASGGVRALNCLGKQGPEQWAHDGWRDSSPQGDSSIPAHWSTNSSGTKHQSWVFSQSLCSFLRGVWPRSRVYLGFDSFFSLVFNYPHLLYPLQTGVLLVLHSLPSKENPLFSYNQPLAQC